MHSTLKTFFVAKIIWSTSPIKSSSCNLLAINDYPRKMSSDTEVNIDMPSDSNTTDEDSLDNGNIAICII